MLTQLHEGHPGATRMKALSRMYMWWPGITKGIEETVRDCLQCQTHPSTPPVAPLHLGPGPLALGQGYISITLALSKEK